MLSRIWKLTFPKNIGQLFKHYKFEDNYTWGSTKEIESQIQCDPAYTKMQRDLNKQKYYLNFITETLNDIKGMGFVIKNYMDYEKIIHSNF